MVQAEAARVRSNRCSTRGSSVCIRLHRCRREQLTSTVQSTVWFGLRLRLRSVKSQQTTLCLPRLCVYVRVCIPFRRRKFETANHEGIADGAFRLVDTLYTLFMHCIWFVYVGSRREGSWVLQCSRRFVRWYPLLEIAWFRVWRCFLGEQKTPEGSVQQWLGSVFVFVFVFVR